MDGFPSYNIREEEGNDIFWLTPLLGCQVKGFSKTQARRGQGYK